MLAELPPGAVKVARYVQLQPVEEQIPSMRTAERDGVAELWVDSVADAAQWFTSETYSTVITAEEENVLDRTKTPFLYAPEETIFG